MNTATGITFRSEQSGDEAAIDVVECRAFRRMCHANMVRAYREQYPAFDPRYSICVWDGNDLVGHALFLPFIMNLRGERVKAIALGIDGVIPERQGEGIGTAMNRYGLDLARADRFAVAVTNGPPGFYSRVGYVPATFGFAKITLDPTALPAPSQPLSPWPVTEDDVPWLLACHEQEWREVDFAWRRTADLREWRALFASTAVWRTPNGRRAAYTEGLPDNRDWWMILGDDPDLVRDVLATLKPRRLQQHPAGWLARNVLDPAWGTAEVDASGPALACELQSGILDDYRATVAAGGRSPGSFVWPLPVMVAS